MARLNDDEIKEAVNNDISTKDKDYAEGLAKFYFKILTETTISITSFRYHYARIALIEICNFLNDKETIANLASFHAGKIAAEKAKIMYGSNKEEDEDDPKPELKPNRVSNAERRAMPGRERTQFTVNLNKEKSDG